MPEQNPEEKPTPGSGFHQFQGTESAFVTYTDAMNASVSADTVTLVFGVRGMPHTPNRANVIVRMSPQFAKRVILTLTPLVDRVVTVMPVKAEEPVKREGQEARS